MFYDIWKTSKIDNEMERLDETNKFKFDSFEVCDKARFVIINERISQNFEEWGNWGVIDLLFLL